jgi:Lrp/AsnC family transcriptional regulator, leucine-responsive regulatory protein
LIWFRISTIVGTCETASTTWIGGYWRRCRPTRADRAPSWPATVVNREAVGLDLLCFIHIMLAHHRPDAIKRFPDSIRKMPEVLECHFLTGEFDYLLKIVVADHEELEKFLFERLMKVPGVDRTRTSIVVKEVKATTSLPL